MAEKRGERWWNEGGIAGKYYFTISVTLNDSLLCTAYILCSKYPNKTNSFPFFYSCKLFSQKQTSCESGNKLKLSFEK